MILFTDKSNCCGCGACANICPKNAISMKTDEYGFVYPEIDNTRCVDCGVCKNVCAYQSELPENSVISAFAAMSGNEQMLKKSASGGVFSAVAEDFLNNNGVVFGCSLEQHDKGLTPEHIRIDNVKDLCKLQGSKYVQSNMNNVFSLVRDDLKSGKKVLFSGTPCQVDSLKHYLHNIDQSNLFTMDLICHGTPNRQLFEDYLAYFEKKHKCRVIDYSFRDKTEGWGLRGKITYINKNKKTCTKTIYPHMTAYYSLFLKSVIYRDCCYSCKYANLNRVGNLTIGDFWGIEKAHPNILCSAGGDFDISKGISCILVNTEKGRNFLEKCGIGLKIYQSTADNVTEQNFQLQHPSIKPENRQQVLDIYKNGGYEAVYNWYNKELGVKRYLSPIRSKLKQLKRKFSKQASS